MIELQGKYNQCKVFTDLVDQTAISQVIELLNQPYVVGSSIRMMPDIHAGVGCTIGTTMTIQDKICPNLVGVDIGCGMETAVIRNKHLDDADLYKLDQFIRNNIPSGFSIRDIPHPYSKIINLQRLYCYNNINTTCALNSIGTLGGGNHFIELDYDSNGNLFVVVHSGSRHLGVEIAKYYQEQAVKQHSGLTSEEVNNIIQKLKSEGRQKDIESYLKKEKEKVPTIPKQLAYVEGSLFDQYLHDMQIAQKYARLNRLAIINSIITEMDFSVAEQFTTIHNYIDTESMILRKGAVSARKGETLLIPINMRDGSLLCIGKGNSDWNYSAPHGAGRLMSRSEAKETFTVDQFKEEMTNVFSTSVNSSTLDECPMAYKSIDSIIENIEDTVEIIDIIKPIYNFKAGEE